MWSGDVEVEPGTPCWGSGGGSPVSRSGWHTVGTEERRRTKARQSAVAAVRAWREKQKLRETQGVASQHRWMTDVNCIVSEAYFQRHCVTLLSVLCTLFIGFPHFGNKILDRFAQDPKKQDEDFSVSWIIWQRKDEVDQSLCCQCTEQADGLQIFFWSSLINNSAVSLFILSYISINCLQDNLEHSITYKHSNMMALPTSE